MGLINQSKNKENVLAVIPARAGSKAIPKKNLRELAGKPLIAYMIESSLHAKNIDRVVVSTDSEEIAAVAVKYGAEVPFLRPKELASDTAPLVTVSKHAMEYLEEKENWKADIVASLQPTSPLIESSDIDKAIDKLFTTGVDSVVSVKFMDDMHPYWALKLIEDKIVPFSKFFSQKYRTRQELPPAYIFSGAIYARRKSLLKNWNEKDYALGKNIRAVIFENGKGIDIDNEIDFLLAELLLKRERGKSKK